MTTQQYRTQPYPSPETPEEEQREWEDQLEDVMDQFSIGLLIEFITQWGYGSGEELHDYLESHGLTYEEATTVCDLLNKVKSG